jgi:adenine-specific DNA-methyltransferase
MLNVILDYAHPGGVSKISGIPNNWNRSDYNRENFACTALRELVSDMAAKYILISFNSEGFVGPEAMKAMLEQIGRLEILETQYNTFRGSRNLSRRGMYVKEYLYLLEK